MAATRFFSNIKFDLGVGGVRIARQMTLMELLGMERQQLQTRRELETLRQESRTGQVRQQSTFQSSDANTEGQNARRVGPRPGRPKSELNRGFD